MTRARRRRLARGQNTTLTIKASHLWSCSMCGKSEIPPALDKCPLCTAMRGRVPIPDAAKGTGFAAPPGAGERFLIISDCKLRAGFEANSRDLGVCQAGQVITALEIRCVPETGVARVQFDEGWVSTPAANGTVLLRKYDPAVDPKSGCVRGERSFE